MVPIWKQTMLTPQEYSEYANLSIKIIYDYCSKKKLPCIKTAKGYKIHREEADRKLAEMAMSFEGHLTERKESITVGRRRIK